MSKELAAYLRGWKSYVGFSQTPLAAGDMDQWITAWSAIHDLEAMEARPTTVREAPPRRGCQGIRCTNSG
jgi:hypothetical protein